METLPESVVLVVQPQKEAKEAVAKEAVAKEEVARAVTVVPRAVEFCESFRYV